MVKIGDFVKATYVHGGYAMVWKGIIIEICGLHIKVLTDDNTYFSVINEETSEHWLMSTGKRFLAVEFFTVTKRLSSALETYVNASQSTLQKYHGHLNRKDLELVCEYRAKKEFNQDVLDLKTSSKTWTQFYVKTMNIVNAKNGKNEFLYFSEAYME